MNVDILNMRGFKENAQAIDVALPVLAVECEATPPLENHLDAYEDAVLKLVALGLSTHGISRTMNATESLIEEILSHLEEKQYACREKGKPWQLTHDGEAYLNGEVEERASKESQYGYMFVNAIKKEVLPFFHQGDVGQIPLFHGKPLPFKLTFDGDEEQTFSPIEIKQARLKKAYKVYFRNIKVHDGSDEDEISKEEPEEYVADLEAFDEEFEEESEVSTGNQTGELSGNMFIRALNKPPMKLYLRMRIVIDPHMPGGYRVEAPFNYNGRYDQFFLRQIQWLEQSESAYIADEALSDFLQKEIHKISPSYKIGKKDFSVFVLERIPRLKLYRSKSPCIYEDLERIYSLMQRQSSLIEQVNIIRSLACDVVEKLFNEYFRSIGSSRLKQIQQKAFGDIKTYGDVNYKKRIFKTAGLPEILPWLKFRNWNSILGRLPYTYGNSILEKFINMLVIEYYLGDVQIRRFFSEASIEDTCRLTINLNEIRNKVSHDTNERLDVGVYDSYIADVFVLINRLLSGFRED